MNRQHKTRDFGLHYSISREQFIRDVYWHVHHKKRGVSVIQILSIIVGIMSILYIAAFFMLGADTVILIGLMLAFCGVILLLMYILTRRA